MGRMIKWLFILAVMGVLIVIGNMFLGDLSAPQKDVVRPVTIDVD